MACRSFTTSATSSSREIVCRSSSIAASVSRTREACKRHAGQAEAACAVSGNGLVCASGRARWSARHASRQDRGRLPRGRFAMLSDSSVTTMLPVKDMARARAFYESSLGLRPGGERPDGKFVYNVGGSTLALFPKAEGTHRSEEHTSELQSRENLA